MSYYIPMTLDTARRILDRLERVYALSSFILETRSRHSRRQSGYALEGMTAWRRDHNLDSGDVAYFATLLTDAELAAWPHDLFETAPLRVGLWGEVPVVEACAIDLLAEHAWAVRHGTCREFGLDLQLHAELYAAKYRLGVGQLLAAFRIQFRQRVQHLAAIAGPRFAPTPNTSRDSDIDGWAVTLDLPYRDVHAAWQWANGPDNRNSKSQ